MVFFICNACNESLKKNQVGKHYQQKCRRCEFLSCIDCGKEFWGDTYQTHTKCISEEEKYSGKNYVAKANKGEVKQELWFQKVQSAIQKAPANPQLKTLLHRLEEYPNVPRKKTKFANFLKCSLRVFNLGLVNQVWDLLMAEAHQQQNGNNAQAPGGEEVKTDGSSGHSQSESKEQGSAVETPATGDKEPEKKLSKRERKGERRKKMHKGEKKDKDKCNEDNRVADEEEEEKRKRKGKRRKRDEEEEEETKAELESQPKKKKKKGQNGMAEEYTGASENGTETQDDSVLAEEKAGKFNWGATITAVLKSKGEISVKKLRKKVLAEYASYGCSKPEEKLLAKFNKKLSKLPTVKVLKDRAKLIQS